MVGMETAEVALGHDRRERRGDRGDGAVHGAHRRRELAPRRRDGMERRAELTSGMRRVARSTRSTKRSQSGGRSSHATVAIVERRTGSRSMYQLKASLLRR